MFVKMIFLVRGVYTEACPKRTAIDILTWLTQLILSKKQCTAVLPIFLIIADYSLCN